MHYTLTLDQVANLSARLAMKGQSQQCLTDHHHGAGPKVVKIVAIHDDILAKGSSLEPERGRHRTRGNQCLSKGRGPHAARDSILPARNRSGAFDRDFVAAFHK
jgi:hypothetical protein